MFHSYAVDVMPYMVFYSLAESGTLCRWSSISVDTIGSTRPLLLDGYVHMHTSYILLSQRELVNLCGAHSSRSWSKTGADHPLDIRNHCTGR